MLQFWSRFSLCLSLTPVVAISLILPKTAIAETNPEIKEAYPPEYVMSYLQDCQETSMNEGLEEIEAKKLCECTLKNFQIKYSLTEFEQLNVAAKTDENASNELIEVGQLCFEELLYE